MNYAYYGTGGIRKMLYQDIDAARIEHGLVRLMRKVKPGDPAAYRIYDPYTTYAIIRLGDGERLVRDES